MKKKALLFLLSAASIIAITSCKNNSQTDPDEFPIVALRSAGKEIPNPNITTHGLWTRKKLCNAYNTAITALKCQDR